MKNYLWCKFNNKGITLISLIVTVIILLILAGIILNLTLGDRGILKIAKQARENYTNAQDKELADLENLYSQIKVATGDNSQLTISIEDLNRLIENKVKESLENNMSTPLKLTKANLPNTQTTTRQAGTYKASSSDYIKNNNENMEKYLKFEEGKGWTILKSGWYYLSTNSYHVNDTELVEIMTTIIINNSVFDTFTIARASSNDPYGAKEQNSATLYLKQGDTIDFEFIINKAGIWSSAEFGIYAMFN